jgi:hypothetical protein
MPPILIKRYTSGFAVFHPIFVSFNLFLQYLFFSFIWDMRPGVLILVNVEAFQYGYYANDSLLRKEIPTQGRYQRWLLTFQTYGVVARNPRANIGMIYGLP